MGNPVQQEKVERKPAVEEQTPEEFELDSFFTFSLDLLCIAGLDGYFKRVNPAFEKTLGYTSEELLATPFLDLVHLDDQAATVAEMEKLNSGIPTIQFENRYRCKDGSYRWLAWTSTPFASKGWGYAVARDITQQKQMETALKELQSRYELVAESSNDGIWDWNLQTNRVYYSPCWKRTLGFEEHEISDRYDEWFNRVHPEDGDQYQAALQEHLEGLTPTFKLEYRLLHKDGTYRWIISRGTCLRDAKGQPYRLVGSNRDITEHKQAQTALLQQTRALQAVHQRLMLHIENSPLGIIEWDKEFRAIYWSRQAETIFGWKAEEVMGKHPKDWKFIHDEDVELVNQILSRLTEGSELRDVNQNRNYTKNGSVLDCEWYNSALFDEFGNLVSIRSQVQDITKRKQAEESLRLTQERLQYLLSNNPAALYSCKLSGDYGFTFISENVTTILGYQAQEFLEDSSFWTNRIHPEDAPHVFANLPQLFEEGHHIHEYRFQHKDGSYRWMHDELKLLRNEAGAPLEIVGYWADITEQKQAESELRKNAEMLRFLLEYTPAAIAMFDKDMKYQLVSRRYLEDYNLLDRDIIGKSFYEVFPKIPARWKTILQQCLKGAVFACEEDLLVRADGKQEWIKWEIRPWASGIREINGIILVAEVITERRKAKENLQRLNEKLLHSNRDLEQFAYVASHDLQEPLRAVNSYAQLLARKYQGNLDAKADKYINYIVEGATRMQQLINDLLEFSRVGTRAKELEPTACETVLSQVLDNLKVAIAESQAVVTHDPLPTVMGDETQLIQLLQNLIGNAIKFRREEPPRVHISVKQQEKEWVFGVRDNGIGIEPEYFERIFTIFQRLHSRSEYPGTGIGLAVCNKIVERHGGRIWVESEPGVGTLFYFTIRILKQ